MKRIIFSLSVVLLSSSAFAQKTAQEIIASVPQVPTVSQLVESQVGQTDYEVFDNFREKLNDAQEECQKVMEKVSEKMQSKMMAAAGTPQTAVRNPALTEILFEISSKRQEITELTMKSMNLRSEALSSGMQLYESSYKEKIQALEEEDRRLFQMTSDGEQTAAEGAKAKELAKQQEAIQKKVEDLKREFYTKALTTWRKAVVDGMDIFSKQVLPLENDLKKAYDKAYELSGQASYLGGELFPYTAVTYFLDVAGSITDFNNFGIE